jgi:hypothetical protein
MPKKGEKMSEEHRKKMAEGRKKASALRKEKPKTTIIDNQVAAMPSNPANDEKVIPNPEDKPEAVKKGVESSGETKAREGQRFLATQNTGNIAISAQLPGQKEEIKKSLKKAVPKLAPVDPKPPQKTADNLKTDDPAAITARAPFSMNALRMKLAIG